MILPKYIVNQSKNTYILKLKSITLIQIFLFKLFLVVFRLILFRIYLEFYKSDFNELTVPAKLTK